MTYKNYKIKRKEIFLEHIKFELNGIVEFSGNSNFIVCPNKLAFKDYQVDDEIEIGLVDDKHIEVKKVSKSLPEDMDVDDGSQLDERENDDERLGLRLSSAQKQLSAYKKQTVHELFRISLEW